MVNRRDKRAATTEETREKPQTKQDREKGLRSRTGTGRQEGGAVSICSMESREQEETIVIDRKEQQAKARKRQRAEVEETLQMDVSDGVVVVDTCMSVLVVLATVIEVRTLARSSGSASKMPEPGTAWPVTVFDKRGLVSVRAQVDVAGLGVEEAKPED